MNAAAVKLALTETAALLITGCQSSDPAPLRVNHSKMAEFVEQTGQPAQRETVRLGGVRTIKLTYAESGCSFFFDALTKVWDGANCG